MALLLSGVIAASVACGNPVTGPSCREVAYEGQRVEQVFYTEHSFGVAWAITFPAKVQVCE